METTLRLGELIAALSLAFDLGNDFPLEKALRNVVLAVGLGREIGLVGEELSDVYYVAQLRYLGCTAFSHELAQFLGVDELAGRSAYAPLGNDAMAAIKTTLTRLGRGAGPVTRTRAILKMAIGGRALLEGGWVADCEAAARLASRLGMSSGVCTALPDVYSSWDGKGVLGRWASGDRVALPARIAFLVHEAEIHHRLGGREAAIEMVRKRAGSEFDPALADAFLRRAPELFAAIEQESVWDVALEMEPEPRPWIPNSRLDAIAQAFGDFADLKSPYTLGHSAGVAELAAAAGAVLRLSHQEIAALRQAGWLHDLGRVSVPNTIWDKAGRLTASEWERVRLHPYHSERVIARSPLLRPLSLAVGMHHERSDGSGYHRGASAPTIPTHARLLGAADVYRAMVEERPYRKVLTAAAAAHELTGEAEAGRLDREAVKAVLEVVGQRTSGRRLAWPKDLSDREVEVLRLAARGKPNREIAGLLHISENTVHHHVKRIYDKIGVSTRAGAALFAMEKDLLHD
jgi:HD-GYP domain-containing protein (c-di-GMP phosphodiesterase class II)